MEWGLRSGTTLKGNGGGCYSSERRLNNIPPERYKVSTFMQSLLEPNIYQQLNLNIQGTFPAEKINQGLPRAEDIQPDLQIQHEDIFRPP